MTTPYQNMDAALAGLSVGPATARIDSFTAAEDIEFGYAVFSYPGEKKAYNYHNDVAKLVFDGDFVASNTIDISVSGEAAPQVTYATSHDNTANLVVDAINTLDGVECVLDSADTDNRTFLIREKGVDTAVTEDVQAGAGQVSGTITYQSGQVFVGLALRTTMPYSGTANYPEYCEVNVLERGKCYVETSSAAVQNQPAFVDNAGSDKGKFANAAGLTVDCRFRSDVASAGLAVVEVNGQSTTTYAESF
jgi:hypothetical protein